MRRYIFGLLSGIFLCLIILSFIKIKTPLISFMGDGDNIESQSTEYSDKDWISTEFLIDYGICAGQIGDTLYFFTISHFPNEITKTVIGDETANIRAINEGRIFVNINDLKKARMLKNQ